MNAHCYRLVFDRRTRTLVPVAEFTVGAKKGNRSGPGTRMNGAAPHGDTLRTAIVLALALFASGASWHACAQMVVAPSTGSPTLGHTANDTPLVHIADPNAAGLSHNKFTQFNVGPDGVVFNNSLRDGTSQTGGFTMKNPHLSRTATGILTEVTGTDVSRLQGTMEVFGGKADLLIANPNGLFVNGVSVLNANTLTLTTGRPDAQGRHFDVRGGRIEIGAGGVSTMGLTHFDVVARSIALHGKVAGESDTLLAAGLNAYDADTRTIRKRADGGAGAPQFAIDGNAAGSMYGTHVRLLSTESGVGVRHPGQITSAGDIRIDANGDLDVRTLHAGADVHLAGRDLRTGGDVRGRSIAIDARALHNRGAIDARNALTIALGDGASVNDGRMFAERGPLSIAGAFSRMTNNGEIATSTGGIDLLLASLDNRGDVLADTSLLIETIGALRNAGLLHADTLAIDAAQATNTGAGARVYATSDLDVAVAGSVHNLAGAWFGAGGDVRIVAAGDVRNDAAEISGDTVIVTAGRDLDNGNAARIEGSNVSVYASGDLRNLAGGVIGADAALHVDAGCDVENAGAIRGHGNALASVGAGCGIVNVGGELSAGELALVAARDIRNIDGAAMLGGTIRIEAGGAVDNGGTRTIDGKPVAAVIAADDRLAISAVSVVNRDNGLLRALDIALSTDANFLNTRSAAVSAARDLALDIGGAFDNTFATLDAGRVLDGRIGGAFTNAGAAAHVRGQLVELLVAGDVFNRHGATMQAGMALLLDARRIENRNARLLAGAQDAGGAVLLGDLRLAARETITNVDGGNMIATGTLAIDAEGNVLNTGGSRIVGAALDVATRGDLVNEANGKLQASDALLATVGGTLDNAGLVSAGDVWMKAATEIRNDGRIVGESMVVADTHAFTGTAGSELLAKDDIDLSAATFANLGKIHTPGHARLSIKDGGHLYLDDGLRMLSAGTRLTLAAHDIHVGRELQNAGDIVLNATGWIDNADGIISGGSVIADAAGSFTNRSLLWALRDVDLRVAGLVNTDEIEAGRDVAIDAGTHAVRNAPNARIAAGRDAWIDAGTLHNEMTWTGGVSVEGTETGTGDSWFNHAGRSDHYQLVVNGLPILGSEITITAQGTIEGGRNVLLNQGAMHGRGGAIVNDGRILARQDVVMDGDVDNRGVSVKESVRDILRRPANFGIQAWALSQHRARSFSSLEALLDGVFSAYWSENMGVAGMDWYSSQVANAIKTYDSPHFNALMSQVMGADWRAASYDQLVLRWNAFKSGGQPGWMHFAGDRGAEIGAGGTIEHAGGHLRHGVGTAYDQNRTVVVTIGEEAVETIAGEFETRVNPGDLTQALDPSPILRDLTRDGSKKFRPAPKPPGLADIDWSQPPGGHADASAPPVYPIFETRIDFIDQSQFFGSDYFFRQVGYTNDRTVTVIGDNYFINALVDRQVTQQVGTFFATRDKLGGADLVRTLMDQAGTEGARLGLQVGQAPSPEQLAKLDRDIVWFVATEVDGQVALVPTVYLAPKTLAEVRDGRTAGAAAIAAGENVFIDADEGGVVNNDGAIRGRNVVIASKGDIVNVSKGGRGDTSGIRAQEIVSISGDGDMRNLGASIDGHDVHINVAGNFTDEARMGYDAKGGTRKLRSGIRGDAATGSVTIEAGGDIALQASEIRAKDVAIRAGGALSSTDVHEVGSSYDSTFERSPLGQTTTTTTEVKATSVGSSIRGASEGGSLVMTSGGDMLLQGGEYGADTGAFKSGGKLVTRAGKDVSLKVVHTLSEGLVLGGRAGIGGMGASGQTGHGGSHGNTAVDGVENPLANDGRPNATGKPVLGETLGFTVGYERIETTETDFEVKHRNAAFDFGSGVTMIAEDTLDIGGADIRAIQGAGDTATRGRIALQGGEVISTKAVDVSKKTVERKESFAGVSASGSSALIDLANNLVDTVRDANAGKQIDPGLKTAQIAGDLLNVATGPLAAASVNVGVKHTESKDTTTTRSQVGNQLLGGDISIVSTKGDIDLQGVDIAGTGTVVLDSARKLKLRAGTTQTTTESSSQTHSLTVGVDVSASHTGGGAGASVSTHSEWTEDKSESLTHDNASVVGGNVVLRAKEGAHLAGANVAGGAVELDIEGGLVVESLQDRHRESGTRVTAGASIGAALSSQSPVTGEVTAGYGESWNHRDVVAEQSGIQAGKLTGKVGGDLVLKGAHLQSEEKGALEVGGKIIAEKIVDRVDRDGHYGSLGVGLDSTGDVSATVEYERSEREQYDADNNASIVGIDYTARGGVQGEVNIDKEKLVDVRVDQTTAAVRISTGLGSSDMKDAKQAVKPKKRANHDAADTTSRKPSRTPGTQDVPKAPKLPVKDLPGAFDTIASIDSVDPKPDAVDRPAREPRDDYDRRVIVQEGDDPVSASAADRLRAKHPENSIVVKPDDAAALDRLRDTTTTGERTKVQVVGHGDSGRTLGGKDATAIADDVARVRDAIGADIAKVALVGCDTGSCGGRNLADDVSQKLKDRDVSAPVVGYDGPVRVTESGRKQATDAYDADALGDTDPATAAAAARPPRLLNRPLPTPGAPKLIDRPLPVPVPNFRETPSADTSATDRKLAELAKLGGLPAAEPASTPPKAPTPPVAKVVPPAAAANTPTRETTDDGRGLIEEWGMMARQYDTKRRQQLENGAGPDSLAGALSDAQFMALGLYTNGNYQNLNKALRSGTPTPDQRQLIDLVTAALANAPAARIHTATTYRGMDLSPAQLQQIMAAGEYRDPAFLSTSKLEDVADGFARVRVPGNIPVLMHVRGEGVDVADVSIEGDEEEILFARHTRFRVVKSTPPAEGRPNHILELEALPPHVAHAPSETLRLEDMVKVGTKMQGEAPGGVFEDKNGQAWFVKGAGNDDRARTEVLAGRLLQRAGVEVPDVRLIELGNHFLGGLGVASKGVDGAGPVPFGDPAARAAIQRDFAAQAWLANWDAIGFAGDNYVRRADGTPVSIDHGGALTYRAGGDPKGDAFGPRVGELETMRRADDPDSVAAKAYRELSETQVREGAHRVTLIRSESVERLVDEHGPRDATKREELARTLNARKAHMAEVAAGAEIAAGQGTLVRIPPPELDTAETPPLSLDSDYDIDSEDDIPPPLPPAPWRTPAAE